MGSFQKISVVLLIISIILSGVVLFYLEDKISEKKEYNNSLWSQYGSYNSDFISYYNTLTLLDNNQNDNKYMEYLNKCHIAKKECISTLYEIYTGKPPNDSLKNYWDNRSLNELDIDILNLADSYPKEYDWIGNLDKIKKCTIWFSLIFQIAALITMAYIK